MTILATIHHDSSRFELDGQSGCIGMEKRKSSIITVSHDAPTVSARFIYGSTTTHDGSATIHPGGPTNAERMLIMRPRFDTVLVRFKPVAPRPPPRTVFVMNRGESRWIGINRAVSHTPIHPERLRITTNTPTVPLSLSHTFTISATVELRFNPIIKS